MDGDWRTFVIRGAVWTAVAKKGDGVPWYQGVLRGAERHMASWHRNEEASRMRAIKRGSQQQTTI